MSDDEFEVGPVFQGAEAPVSAFMSDEVVTVAPDATLRDVAQVISEQTVGLVVIGSAERVLGVISERDLVRSTAGGSDPDSATASDLASDRLVWVDADSTVGEAATHMVEGYLRHVLVGDGERCTGVVSMRDVIAAFTAM